MGVEKLHMGGEKEVREMEYKIGSGEKERRFLQKTNAERDRNIKRDSRALFHPQRKT